MQPVQCSTQFVGLSHNYVAIKKGLNIKLGNAGCAFAGFVWCGSFETGWITYTCRS